MKWIMNRAGTLRLLTGPEFQLTERRAELAVMEAVDFPGEQCSGYGARVTFDKKAGKFTVEK